MLPRDKDLSGFGFGSRRNYASSAESPFMSLRFVTFVDFRVMIRVVEKKNWSNRQVIGEHGACVLSPVANFHNSSALPSNDHAIL